MTRPVTEPIIRFLKYISINCNECWVWIGSTTPSRAGRYGTFGDGKRLISSHRFSYQYFIGDIPKDKEIDHLCRNTLCCNPDHLEAVTHHLNVLRGKTANKTHCPKGHPYDNVNTYYYINTFGYLARNCKTCMRERTTKIEQKNTGLP